MCREPVSLRPCRQLACVLLAVLSLLSGCQLASHGLNMEGTRLHQQGNYQAATERFLKSIANNPKNPDGYYNLAATYHRMGKLSGKQSDLKQAEDYYNQCLDHDPNHTDCYRGLAVLLAETGRTDASLRLIQGWAARSPTLADPKIELARLMDEYGNPDIAKTNLLEALALEPNNARALTALGHLREKSGENLQALSDYERSLAVNRFQPQVATRVAALQTAVGGPVRSTTGDTRLVREPLPQSRY